MIEVFRSTDCTTDAKKGYYKAFNILKTTIVND